MGRRGVPCTVCASKNRAQVDIGLVHKVPARALAARFDLSKDAIARHRAHLSPVQRAALLTASRTPTAIDLEQLRTTESEGLLSQLVAQRARLQQCAELALELADVRASVSAESGITANLALVGKLLGQLVTRHDVRHSSVLLSPDYVRLRQALILALRPHAAAARAVSEALHRIEMEAATEIADSAKPVQSPKVIEHAALPSPPATIPPPPVTA